LDVFRSRMAQLEMLGIAAEDWFPAWKSIQDCIHLDRSHRRF
jgi:hypothetical protein